jgi:hypothetical protein
MRGGEQMKVREATAAEAPHPVFKGDSMNQPKVKFVCRANEVEGFPELLLNENAVRNRLVERAKFLEKQREAIMQEVKERNKAFWKEMFVILKAQGKFPAGYQDDSHFFQIQEEDETKPGDAELYMHEKQDVNPFEMLMKGLKP